jgi:hypothetical protein
MIGFTIVIGNANSRNTDQEHVQEQLSYHLPPTKLPVCCSSSLHVSYARNGHSV